MNDDLLHRIDSRFEEQYPTCDPGAAVILVKGGQTAFRKGYGMANVELRVPIEPDMVFRLGSISKQFTAVAILILLEQKDLSLHDTITKFLPSFPTHNHLITVEHLLTHTSGIKNYTDLPEWKSSIRRDFAVEELIDFFKHQPLQYVPGKRFSYSNSGYVLLGAIIEKITGIPYGRFVQQSIFGPLGMKNSHYDTPDRIIPGRVAGYQKGREGYRNAAYISMTQPYSAGALASTVDDLSIWDSALYTDKLVRQETLRRAHAPTQLPNGNSTNYGYGWRVETLNGRKLLSHDGHIEGFSSNAIRVPDDRLFVVVLSNNEAKRDLPKELTTEIVHWTLGGLN